MLRWKVITELFRINNDARFRTSFILLLLSKWQPMIMFFLPEAILLNTISASKFRSINENRISSASSSKAWEWRKPIGLTIHILKIFIVHFRYFFITDCLETGALCQQHLALKLYPIYSEKSPSLVCLFKYSGIFVKNKHFWVENVGSKKKPSLINILSIISIMNITNR